MANNFYTATEALLRAYEEIDRNHNLIEIGPASITLPNRTEFYAKSLGLSEPTLTQKLLSYYGASDEVFSSKESKQNDVMSAAKKDAATVDYILDGLADKIVPTDNSDIRLSDEELEDTYNELFTSVNVIGGEFPEIDNPFASEEDSHNQKPLEPNEGDSE